MTNIFDQLVKQNVKQNVNQDGTSKCFNLDLTFVITDDVILVIKNDTDNNINEDINSVSNRGTNNVSNNISNSGTNDDIKNNSESKSKSKSNNNINSISNSVTNNNIKKDIIKQIENHIPQYKRLIQNYYTNQANLHKLLDKYDYIIQQIHDETNKLKLKQIIKKKQITLQRIKELRYTSLVINKKLLIEQEILTDTIERQTGLTLKQPLFQYKKQNMDIQCSNPDHVPKQNHFYEIVTKNIKDTTYNPEKEKEKYSFDNITKLRKQK